MGNSAFTLLNWPEKGSRAFEMYAVTEVPKPRQVVTVLYNGSVRVSYV
jgi:hypothetical protein